MNKKEVFLELLDMYDNTKQCVIHENVVNVFDALDDLADEVEGIKQKFDEAD